MGWGSGMMDGGWWWPMIGIHGLWWLILVGLAVWLVVALVRSGTGGGEARPRRTALDILEDRYASGEVDREEFLARRRDLKG